MNDLAQLNQLRKQYCEAILVVDTEEEIRCILPSLAQSNFGPIMKGVTSLLRKEIAEYARLISKIKDETEKKEYIIESKKLQFKLKLCDQIMRERFTVEEKEEEKVDNSKKVHVIFGTTPGGNIAFLNDLKRDVDRHYYQDVLNLLNNLESGEFTFNPEKVKMFTNDPHTNGLLELKSYQLRILFKQLPNNMIYVYMIRVKKDNLSKKDLVEPRIRKDLLNKDCEAIQRRIQKGDRVEELIIENQEILEDIKQYLEKNMILGGKAKNGNKNT